MRYRLASLAIILSVGLAVSAAAQMRSNVSAGRGFVGQRNAPTMITRPGFGHFHQGNHFGNFLYPLYPYGFYDDFYDERYSAPVEQPAPVIVVRDDRPAYTPAPTPPVPPAEPKLIEVPEAAGGQAAARKIPTAVFILTDGRRLEAQNYTVTDSLLTIKEAHRPAVQVPVGQLNVEATLAENRQRGLNLQLPENDSEILISF
jgi:hypothetical protein